MQPGTVNVHTHSFFFSFPIFFSRVIGSVAVGRSSESLKRTLLPDNLMLHNLGLHLSSLQDVPLLLTCSTATKPMTTILGFITFVHYFKVIISVLG